MGLVGFGSEGKVNGIGCGTLATALGTFGRRGWPAGCGSPRGSSCLACFLPVCALVRPISFLCPAHWLILAGNLLFHHRLRPFHFVISHEDPPAARAAVAAVERRAEFASKDRACDRVRGRRARVRVERSVDDLGDLVRGRVEGRPGRSPSSARAPRFVMQPCRGSCSGSESYVHTRLTSSRASAPIAVV